ncbi:Nif3-like dinuclear metal center hexameric protein [Zhihengliuella halotolerans]|uniref:GTP cyclohydrolase 1 type 2 homolog n=1 Tax=Zhihengliuella halotolerans TaxID=370736 RepID=A0A4Q8ACT2_9MICC|nr:Nif3-like dinuclear metal center hexameric protein [Zhihengliuella halotolerans]RZU61455.1 dinuclear metal center YbgI/SA1388 family protein [Zhihengliuella halotolerans]
MQDETEKQTAASENDETATPEVAEAVAGENTEDTATADDVGPEATLGDILIAVEELWPASLAEKWDRVGLVAGRTERPVRRVLFAVDPTLDVVRDAVARGTDLLITHHPLMLRGVNSVAATDPKGEVVHELIEGRCALLTVHTNGDSAVGGVSDVLADIFGLQDVEPLSAADEGLPEEGIGRIGDLPQAVTLGDFAATVYGAMPAVAGGVRVAGDRQAVIRRVAVCGGAGDSLMDTVREAGADVYVTGDLRHHPALEARETARGQRPYLIDVSHFASEWLWLPAAADALTNVLSDQNFDVEVQVSSINSDPWDFVMIGSPNQIDL